MIVDGDRHVTLAYATSWSQQIDKMLSDQMFGKVATQRYGGSLTRTPPIKK